MPKQNISANEPQGESFADRASSAFSQFGDTASSKIDNSPLIALAGGIAIGALIAAVLRQTERETELLQPVGSKVTDAGRTHIDKLREAGKAKVDELAGDKLRDFFGYGSGSASSTAA
jgi:hypothetical protein